MIVDIYFRPSPLSLAMSGTPIHTGEYYYYDKMTRVYHVLKGISGAPFLVTEDMLVSKDEYEKDQRRMNIEKRIADLQEELRSLQRA